MVIGALHLGHGPCLPANFSLTWKRALQLGQTTEMGMAIQHNGARNRKYNEPVHLV